MTPAPRRLLALAAAAATVGLAAPAGAHAATVSGGTLDWTMANYYASGDALRTWLGYVTNSGAGPAFSNGSATATAPATLTNAAGGTVTTVDGASATGLGQLFTFGFPVASGDYDEATNDGSVELTGTITFITHALPITVVDPIVTLDGDSGTLAASGETASRSGDGTSPYDRSKPQFTLDLSHATVGDAVGGGRVISGIVPVGTADTVVGFGAGTRNYGTLTLRLAVATTSEPSQPGAQGPAGPAGPRGAAGKAGRSAKIASYTLKRAPFATSSSRKVKLLARKTGKVVSSGTLKGRKLRLSYLSGTKKPKGSYVLRLASGKVAGKSRATITLK